MSDLAETNLNFACGLPGSETLDVAGYLRQLDTWARLVAAKTERFLPMFHRSPAEFDGSLPKFRMMALVTVLQRDLGVRYDPACREGPYCALDPRTLFIARSAGRPRRHLRHDAGPVYRHRATVGLPAAPCACRRTLLRALGRGRRRAIQYRGDDPWLHAARRRALPPLAQADPRRGHWTGPFSSQPHPARGVCRVPPPARAVLAGPPADRGSPGSLRPSVGAPASPAGSRLRLGGSDDNSPPRRKVGRETLLRMELRDIAFLPFEPRCDPRLGSLALDELKRIVSNYRERRMPISVRDRAASCHA